MKQLFKIDESEKRRILEMHENATRKNYLNEATEKCVVKEPTDLSEQYKLAISFAGGDFCKAVDSNQPMGILGKFIYNRTEKDGMQMINFYMLNPGGPSITYQFTLQRREETVGKPYWQFQNLHNFTKSMISFGVENGRDWKLERAQTYLSGLNGLFTNGFDGVKPSKEVLSNYIIGFMNFYKPSTDSTVTGPMVNSLGKVNAENKLNSYPELDIVAQSLLPQQTQQTQQPATRQ